MASRSHEGVYEGGMALGSACASPRALAMAPRHRGLFLLSITHLGAQPNPGPPRLRIKPLMDANRGAIELFIRL